MVRKPAVGGDRNRWGAQLNTFLDDLDARTPDPGQVAEIEAAIAPVQALARGEVVVGTATTPTTQRKPDVDIRDYAPVGLGNASEDMAAFAAAVQDCHDGLYGGIYVPKTSDGTPYMLNQETPGSSQYGGIRLKSGVHRLTSNGATLQLNQDTWHIAGQSTMELPAKRIVVDVSWGDTTVTLNDVTNLEVGDDVYLRVGQNPYQEAEPIFAGFAKITAIVGTDVTIDRPILVDMVVADTHEFRRTLGKLTDVIQDVTVGGFHFVTNGTAKSLAATRWQFARDLRIYDLTGTNVGTGFINAQWCENITGSRFSADQIVNNGVAATDGRLFSFSNTTGVEVDTYRGEDFDGEVLMMESYCKTITFRNGVLHNTSPRRDNASWPLISCGAESDVTIDGLRVDGNGGASLLGLAQQGDLGVVEVRGLRCETITPMKDITTGVVQGEMLINGQRYRAPQPFQAAFRISPNMSAVDILSLPLGIFRSITIYVSSATGITSAMILGSGAIPDSSDFAGSLASGAWTFVPGSNIYGTSSTWNDGQLHTLRLSTNGTVPANTWGMVKVQYFPTGPNDNSQTHASAARSLVRAGELWSAGDAEIDGALNHDGTTAGFMGATPVGKRTLGAAATDAATTQTLANNIRQALIDLGLGQT